MSVNETMVSALVIDCPSSVQSMPAWLPVLNDGEWERSLINDSSRSFSSLDMNLWKINYDKCWKPNIEARPTCRSLPDLPCVIKSSLDELYFHVVSKRAREHFDYYSNKTMLALSVPRNSSVFRTDPSFNRATTDDIRGDSVSTNK